jgi:hypothetical protein
MEARKTGGGGQRALKGKKIGFRHKLKMGTKKPVFNMKKKENKSSQLKAAIDALTAQYEGFQTKNFKKFR